MGLLVKAHNVILALACGFRLESMSHSPIPLQRDPAGVA